MCAKRGLHRVSLANGLRPCYNQEMHIHELICCLLDPNMGNCWHDAPSFVPRGSEAGKVRCRLCCLMLPDVGCPALPGGCCTGSYSWGDTSAADHTGDHQ